MGPILGRAAPILVVLALGASLLVDADKSHQMGEWVKHGAYIQSRAVRAWWADKLDGKEIAERKAKKRFLCVQIEVKNTGTRPRTFFPVTAFDRIKGGTYKLDDYTFRFDGGFPIVDNVEPNSVAKGFLVFDVGPGLYSLEVPGGIIEIKVDKPTKGKGKK